MSDERDQFAELTTVRMCFRDEGDPKGEPLLLIMGLSSQLIHWPQEVVDALGERGYRVIRPDNRDSGLTEWKEAPRQYFLRALARDTVELLDHLGIEQAHVVGASMGGMIAQLLAIEHAPRVRSLCSMMSTPHFSIGMGDGEVLQELAKPLPPERAEAITQIADLYALIGSKTCADNEHERRLALATEAYDRAQHPDGGARQVTAALIAPGRRRRLQKLRIPALVIHGAEDPLIKIAGGEATHAALADSAYLPLDAMGHDLPEPLLDQVTAAIAENAARA
ncbi:alpha/beta fold hydrolase [Streptomyces benahoarensis]|uniref:Alpha/beta hydrolase n=1 Tax=Streptomyces benahoarensis TaxID=2595054 RepID=A0A553ZK41_9ACTN|nr:alpha/beta hydrolase [Streptomyces benahoarensis]TSB26674.1 alpha/beta hydrolase [Streptomyces benahoarensis]TSB41834.1 alpha/beta hydrolase [Streptomyces benahoarensis]